jgi:hypothetical protein
LDIVLDIPNVPPIAPDVAAPLNLVLAIAAVAPANVRGGYLFLLYKFY